MGKRANGEGSISRHKQSGLYMARYTVQTATGPKRKTVYGKTRREVDEKLTKAKADRDVGLAFDADAGHMTVGTFMERWLEDSVRGSVRQSTYDRNESLCRKHLVPALGKKKLKTLNAADVQRFYRLKLDSGLSSATVHKLHVVLHKVLKQAARWGFVTRNVADDVDPPKVHKEEVSPLSNEEARRLLATVKGDRLEALYVVAVHSGLRQGELLALRWEDVDLEACTVQVRRTITRDGGKLAIGPTKTSKGRRTVKLTQDATEALRDHLERQFLEIDKARDRWQDSGLVFCTGKGTLINPTNLRRRSLAPLLQRAALPPITFHQLRHTSATILLLKNVNPKVVSEMLGHATIAITLDTYSHVLPNMQHSAVAAMEEAFS